MDFFRTSIKLCLTRMECVYDFQCSHYHDTQAADVIVVRKRQIICEATEFRVATQQPHEFERQLAGRFLFALNE